MRARLLSIIAFVVLLFLVVVVFVCLGPDAASSTEASPSPSPSVTATPTPPASSALVRWARGQRKAALAQRRTLCRVRACFDDSAPVRVAELPLRGASAEVWRQAGKQCRHQAKDWRGKIDKGIWKMKHPGGSGASRWLPLCWWVGWPRSEAANIVYCIEHESGGSPGNDRNPICKGLWQEHICHAASFRRVTGRPFFPHVFHPLYATQFALWLWRHQGWGPWVAMRGRR